MRLCVRLSRRERWATTPAPEGHDRWTWGISGCDTLADFANLVLAGRVFRLVRPSFFGATLLPFAKKDEGLRPIAVGLTLRKLVAKAVATVTTASCISVLAPSQLGVGTKGGAEAVVHAARRYLDAMSEDRAFVKLDFTNAFNSIRRDSVFEAVAATCPDLLPYVLSSYATPSNLWLGDKIISSEEGVQQGDPLDPLLFCLTIHPLISGCNCEFVTGYLDDVGMGDTVPRLIEHLRILETEALSLGLSLNHAKCEIVGLAPTETLAWHKSGLSFIITDRKDTCLLGSPLSPDGVDAAVKAKEAELREVVPRLRRLASHEAFYLLKSCLAVPRLQYMLRSSPTFASKTLPG